MSSSSANRIVEIVAALLILLFTYTAISKLWEFSHFRLVLSASPLIGEGAKPLSIALPVLELFISLLLFLPYTRLAGLYASVGLLALFTVYLGYMILFTPDLPCSCGGVLKQMSWRQHIICNLVFMVLAMLAIILRTRYYPFIAINRHSRTPV